MSATGRNRIDLLLLGGGLANGLIAYRLATARPELNVVVLDAADRLGGGGTWSFHETDVTPEAAGWLDPFVVHRWPDYDVAFPGGHARRVGVGYRSVTAERFHDVLAETLGDRLRLGRAVKDISPAAIRLAHGEAIEAGAVLDGRGFRPSPHLTLAWQKFLGLELRFEAPHGLTAPIVMDATVAQEDGFRFVYVLPFGPDTALVEDTYYADGPALDRATLRARIHAYAAGKGWAVAAVLREEAGVLPITLDGDVEAFWRANGPVPTTGLRAGLFHPTTGYSLPDAVRLADRIAALPSLDPGALAHAIQGHAIARWRGQRFFRALNRMLFRAGDPAERFRMLARFYRLPEASIRRFYAGELSFGDRVRLLSGRPPVPVLGALRALVTDPARPS